MPDDTRDRPDPILDYADRAEGQTAPRHARLAALGAVTGVVTFGLGYVFGWCTALGAGAVLAALLGAACARRAPARPFLGGLIGTTVAWAVSLGAGVLLAVFHRPFADLRSDPAGVALFAAAWFGAFVIPGVLGSLWVWEGIRGAERLAAEERAATRAGGRGGAVAPPGAGGVRPPRIRGDRS